MFIGREKELSALEKMYKSDKFEFAVIYGRRRVGKTALINRFIEHKKAVYFMGVESNEKQNLENFSRSIFEYSGKADNIEAGAVFPSYQAALEYMFRLSENERVVLAVDEYPYAARSSPSLASTLQLLIDRYKDSSKLMLILCGSSMSYMEDKVLAYKAPLYGRRTAQIKLAPFSFEEACRYLSAFSNEEKAVLYGAVGGTPQYLLQIDNKLDFAENIKKIYLDATSFLYEEPLNLLKQEVREPNTYTAIISAIANGASRMSEISGKVGETTNVCSAYIKSLINLGILKKETPYGETASRKAIYAVDDNVFRFWYRFVLPNSSVISRGGADTVYSRIAPQLTDYMGRIFEDICAQYLWKLLLDGKSPVSFASLGRWWGNDSKQKKQTEIDIMGEQDKNTALFAECKWTNEKIDAGVLDALIQRGELFSYADVYYFLFAKSGFTKGCSDKAEALGNVRLVSFEDMF